MKPSTLGAAMVAPSSRAPTTKPEISLDVSPSISPPSAGPPSPLLAGAAPSKAIFLTGLDTRAAVRSDNDEEDKIGLWALWGWRLGQHLVLHWSPLVGEFLYFNSLLINILTLIALDNILYQIAFGRVNLLARSDNIVTSYVLA